MNQPKTIAELIDRWPTIGAFASAIGCEYEAARKMRERESIAPKHWAAVINAADGNEIPGISYEWLASQRAKPGVAA